jgi:hypothetical protein
LNFSERVRKWLATKKPAKTPAAVDQQYVDKLDAGLFTLQLVALILADVCVHGAQSCRDRAAKLLNMKSESGQISFASTWSRIKRGDGFDGDKPQNPFRISLVQQKFRESNRPIQQTIEPSNENGLELSL